LPSTFAALTNGGVGGNGRNNNHDPPPRPISHADVNSNSPWYQMPAALAELQQVLPPSRFQVHAHTPWPTEDDLLADGSSSGAARGLEEEAQAKLNEHKGIFSALRLDDTCPICLERVVKEVTAAAVPKHLKATTCAEGSGDGSLSAVFSPTGFGEGALKCPPCGEGEESVMVHENDPISWIPQEQGGESVGRTADDDSNTNTISSTISCSDKSTATKLNGAHGFGGASASGDDSVVLVAAQGSVLAAAAVAAVAEGCTTLPCGHGFHDACCKEWFNRSSKCPTCRFQLSNASIDGALKLVHCVVASECKAAAKATAAAAAAAAEAAEASAVSAEAAAPVVVVGASVESGATLGAVAVATSGGASVPCTLRSSSSDGEQRPQEPQEQPQQPQPQEQQKQQQHMEKLLGEQPLVFFGAIERLIYDKGLGWLVAETTKAADAAAALVHREASEGRAEEGRRVAAERAAAEEAEEARFFAAFYDYGVLGGGNPSPRHNGSNANGICSMRERGSWLIAGGRTRVTWLRRLSRVYRATKFWT
jgi:hypothetical protein